MDKPMSRPTAALRDAVTLRVIAALAAIAVGLVAFRLVEGPLGQGAARVVAALALFAGYGVARVYLAARAGG